MLNLPQILLSNVWHLGKFLVPLAVGGYFGYDIGHTQATRAGELRFAKLAERTANDLKRAADLRQQQLAAALAEQQRLHAHATQLGGELIQTRARLTESQRQLARRIPDATRNDGPRFTGLGPDSLRLYQQLLGYSATDVAADLPATDGRNAGDAGQAAGPQEGLPPADLLEHAGDYGQWCQQLDAQLNAYLRLHQGAR